MKRWLYASVGLVCLAASMPAQTPVERIQAGDAAYAAFDDAKALESYREALKLQPASYEALWKTSRALVDLADLLPEKDPATRARQLEMFAEAVAVAEKAIAANPDDSWGYFQLAAANGKRLLLLGKQQQIDASKAVRSSIDRALAIDPSNDLAHHALGRWHRRIAEIGGVKRLVGGLLYGSIPKGSLAESEKSLRRATELNPKLAGHHLELGRTLVALKRPAEAEASFKTCIDLPKTSSKDDRVKSEARAELDLLRKK
jgi:tetratricopeptide (TPR) repeat protein